MLLIGLRNTTPQDLVEGSILNLGEVYRRYDKKGSCGCRSFEANGNSVALQSSGIYHLTAVITFTAPAPGDVTFQLNENGVSTVGAVSTTTVTTATTEVNNAVIDFYILVESALVLNAINTLKNISIVNTGVDSTVTNVVVNIDKVV